MVKGHPEVDEIVVAQELGEVEELRGELSILLGALPNIPVSLLNGGEDAVGGF